MTKIVKKKMPFVLRFIRWAFPKVERLMPGLAGKWAWKLFFTPFRFPVPVKEQELANQANKFSFEKAGYTIQGYEWGSGSKTIFLLHGWSGRATQWLKFVPALIEEGYKVIAIDGPAHANSSGKMTDILKFNEVLHEVFRRYPEIDSAITHSFGGAATLVAISQGLPINRIVNIGTPTDADYIISDFLRRINASAQSGERFKQKVRDDFNMEFEDISVKVVIKSVPDLDLLMIHDRHDKEVPVQHAIDVHEANPNTQLHITEGLGHMRILKDASVIQKAIEFVSAPQPKLIDN